MKRGMESEWKRKGRRKWKRERGGNGIKKRQKMGKGKGRKWKRRRGDRK